MTEPCPTCNDLGPPLEARRALGWAVFCPNCKRTGCEPVWGNVGHLAQAAHGRTMVRAVTFAGIVVRFAVMFSLVGVALGWIPRGWTWLFVAWGASNFASVAGRWLMVGPDDCPSCGSVQLCGWCGEGGPAPEAVEAEAPGTP